MPVSSLPQLSPHFLNNFHILEQIGAGGFGVCYKVSPRSDPDRTLAVKLIVKQLLNPRERLLKTRNWGHNNSGASGLEKVEGGWVVPVEAWVMRNAGNGGTVGFVDLFADEHIFYLVMEYHGTNWRDQLAHDAPGPTLPPSPPLTPTALAPTALPIPSPISTSSSATRPGPAPTPMMRQSSSDLFDCIEAHNKFDEDLSKHIFSQVLDTVIALARRGVAHCDIKDENIVVDEQFRVKLVDFGSAYLFDPSSARTAIHTSPFSGSMTYAPPEVLESPHEYPLLTGEVWALGVLLNILLTGHSPFSSRACQKLGRRLKKKGWSEEVEEVLDGCLRVDVSERWTLERLRACAWLNATAE